MPYLVIYIDETDAKQLLDAIRKSHSLFRTGPAHGLQKRLLSPFPQDGIASGISLVVRFPLSLGDKFQTI